MRGTPYADDRGARRDARRATNVRRATMGPFRLAVQALERPLGPEGKAARKRGPAGMVEHVAKGYLIETGRPSQCEYAVASEGGRERRLSGNGEKAPTARKPSGSS